MTFDRETGVYEALRKKLREFDPLPVREPRRRGEALIPSSQAGSVGGGTPTIVVAAADAFKVPSGALVCTGVDDHVVFQAALDLLPAGGGRIVLTEGTYSLSATVNVPAKNVHFQGIGYPTVDGVNVPLAGNSAIWFKTNGASGVSHRSSGIRFSGGKSGDRPIAHDAGEIKLFVDDCVFQD